MVEVDRVDIAPLYAVGRFSGPGSGVPGRTVSHAFQVKYLAPRPAGPVAMPTHIALC